MRSLAEPMIMAPAPETSRRTCSSGPSTPSRFRKLSPTMAVRRTAELTSTPMRTLAPSMTTAPSMWVWAPLVRTESHWNRDSTRAAVAVNTVRLLTQATSRGRRSKEDQTRMTTPPPNMTMTGRIDR